MADTGHHPPARRLTQGGGRGLPRRWGTLTLGLVLLALAPGTPPVPVDAWADEAPVGGTAAPAGTAPPAPERVQAQVEPPVDPATQVDILTQRMRGIEGKLKESAAARKSADQARMEAERRLAEGTQEAARLSAELVRLREAKADLETQLRRAQEQNADTAAQLAATAHQVRDLTTAAAAQTERGADLERQLEQHRQEQRRDEADFLGRLRAAEEAQAGLSAQLLEREGNLTRLNAELGAVKTQRDALDERLKTLSALVPTPAGGALTLEAAQARSATAAAALRNALTRAEAGGDAQLKRAVREAQQALHRAQFTAAQVAEAHSVYQVRPADTLVLIANRIYGDGARWRAIREANRHVLADPDRLTPGLTLVIP
ncbi:LysM peptidoglycan-binding domain-containing protein [Candidatus Thiodictyon syntrophicum]|uniref:LysM domain-containing protein n=1 Tax=Candidatus Thiodictyon syntrophicum TaxID=1166950 RepID=A0A2K8U3V8_9GAMM|nr:LysM peptidoglycan-binding domain-containing protein [Candidatus Thiodictyon syntrophicum]AUB80237.1 hypothetical protein THSYN_04180 [Candidatus Thiodictyon syntrophicum]